MWGTPLVPVLGKQKQPELCEFKANQSYIMETPSLKCLSTETPAFLYYVYFPIAISFLLFCTNALLKMLTCVLCSWRHKESNLCLSALNNEYSEGTVPRRQRSWRRSQSWDYSGVLLLTSISPSSFFFSYSFSFFL